MYVRIYIYSYVHANTHVHSTQFCLLRLLFVEIVVKNIEHNLTVQ